MRAVDIIQKKRDGGELSDEEIRFFVSRYVRGEVPDYQAAALCMAVFFRGMSPGETGWLTRAMIDSGDLLELRGVEGPLVDKHSTGGVGDKVSLVLAPVAAACGLKVPMMSGRGLGHTGGTLDKLESIPGYRTELEHSRILEGLRDVGYVMIGQSDRLVPADRMLYALRDVTATVESIPLITASIISKKLAEGARSLVMDVKCGAGAFMPDLSGARELSWSLVRTGQSLGLRVVCLITDMSSPLGRTIGNFLEVREAIECLEGRGDPELMEVTLRLAGWMLALGGRASDVAEGVRLAESAIRDGSARERFLANVRLQGGDPEVCRDPSRGPVAAVRRVVRAPASGVLARMDARAMGVASMVLGAGRERKEDSVLPGAGIELLRKVGEQCAAGEELCVLHTDVPERLETAERMVLEACAVEPGRSREAAPSRVIEEIRAP